MIRSLEKIKTLEEYNIAKKDLDYYVSEYKWVSKSENPKLEIEEEIKACSDELHEGMDYDEELDLLEKIHTLKTKDISIIRGKYKPALRRNITGLVLMMEQFEAANQDISFGELAKGLIKGDTETKEYFRKKYMFTLANMYGSVPAPESLNIESRDDILDYIAKNYDLVDIDLSDRNVSDEEVGLVPFEEPVVGIKSKVLEVANREVDKCIEVLSQDVVDLEKTDNKGAKIQVKRDLKMHSDDRDKKSSIHEKDDKDDKGEI